MRVLGVTSLRRYLRFHLSGLGIPYTEGVAVCPCGQCIYHVRVKPDLHMTRSTASNCVQFECGTLHRALT